MARAKMTFSPCLEGIIAIWVQDPGNVFHRPGLGWRLSIKRSQEESRGVKRSQGVSRGVKRCQEVSRGVCQEVSRGVKRIKEDRAKRKSRNLRSMSKRLQVKVVENQEKV
jgi:hypothetical protein